MLTATGHALSYGSSEVRSLRGMPVMTGEQFYKRMKLRIPTSGTNTGAEEI